MIRDYTHGYGLRSAMLHRLNLPGFPEVHHKDEKRGNFARSNLEGYPKSEHRSLHSSRRKNQVTFRCQNCNKVLSARKSTHRHRFCSRPCWYAFRRQNYKVVSVEPAQVEEVFCFTIADTETFVLSNGLVSGNCKNAAHQTDPPPIEECRTSRFTHGAILSFDLSQIELRVAALLSGDPFYVNAYILNHDLHVRQAVRIWGTPELISRYPSLASLDLDSWKKVHAFDRRERQVGKRVNFSHLFRAGASKMQASVHADINELFPLHLFEAIVSSRQSELPLLWEWQERILAEARATGRVLLPFTGQSRSFLGGTDYDVNEIVNFPIQTTASNTLLRIAVRLRHLIRAHRLTTTVLPFLNVYDALKFDCATPSALSSLRTLIPEAVAHVESHEYWSWLQDLHGRRIPLQYSIEEHHAHEHPSPPLP